MPVISAFPGTGKSHFVARNPGALDSDSSQFSWESPGVRHPQWPNNYIQHIREAHEAGKTVFVSSHKEVRQALWDARIPTLVVLPWCDDATKAEYLRRYKERGSDQSFIDLVDKNWKVWIMEALAEPEIKFPTFVLGKEETISTTEHQWIASYRDAQVKMAQLWRSRGV